METVVKEDEFENKKCSNTVKHDDKVNQKKPKTKKKEKSHYKSELTHDLRKFDSVQRNGEP